MARKTNGTIAFPAAQMLSAKHDTNAIHAWLNEWIRTGAKIPDDAVMDGSKALLSACIRAFTNCETIYTYADECFNCILGTKNKLPRTFIRLDVAHYIKTWRDFLCKAKPDMNTNMKRFYLSSIGQAVMAETFEKFQNIIESLLIVSRSTYDGMYEKNLSTPCHTHKLKIKKLITLQGEHDHQGNNILYC